MAMESNLVSARNTLLCEVIMVSVGAICYFTIPVSAVPWTLSEKVGWILLNGLGVGGAAAFLVGSRKLYGYVTSRDDRSGRGLLVYALSLFGILAFTFCLYNGMMIEEVGAYAVFVMACLAVGGWLCAELWGLGLRIAAGGALAYWTSQTWLVFYNSYAWGRGIGLWDARWSS